MYWLHEGPSMEPSTGGTGTAAMVNMESIPMGIASSTGIAGQKTDQG
jgi:hypothetical protein